MMALLDSVHWWEESIGLYRLSRDFSISIPHRAIVISFKTITFRPTVDYNVHLQSGKGQKSSLKKTSESDELEISVGYTVSRKKRTTIFCIRNFYQIVVKFGKQHHGCIAKLDYYYKECSPYLISAATLPCKIKCLLYMYVCNTRMERVREDFKFARFKSSPLRHVRNIAWGSVYALYSEYSPLIASQFNLQLNCGFGSGHV